MEHRRRIAIGVTAALLAITAARHPTTDIRILTHDPADTAPRRLSAAVDFGLVGVSVLVTWTARKLVR